MTFANHYFFIFCTGQKKQTYTTHCILIVCKICSATNNSDLSIQHFRSDRYSSSSKNGAVCDAAVLQTTFYLAIIRHRALLYVHCCMHGFAVSQLLRLSIKRSCTPMHHSGGHNTRRSCLDPKHA